MNKGKHKEICRAKYKIPDSKFILDIVILDNEERLITEKSLLKFLEVTTGIDGYEAFEHI
jgi:hypothetical protein